MMTSWLVTAWPLINLIIGFYCFTCAMYQYLEGKAKYLWIMNLAFGVVNLFIGIVFLVILN